MKCCIVDCNNDSKEVTGYFFDNGGSAEEGDFICYNCFQKMLDSYVQMNRLRRIVRDD